MTESKLNFYPIKPVNELGHVCDRRIFLKFSGAALVPGGLLLVAKDAEAHPALYIAAAIAGILGTTYQVFGPIFKIPDPNGGTIVINGDVCIQCGACEAAVMKGNISIVDRVCPVNAIEIE